MFRTVLLPVDFAEDNALMLAFARGLPALGVHRIVLGHVVEVSGVESALVARRVDEARERIRLFAPALEEVGLGVEIRVATGDPVEELAGLAAEGETRVTDVHHIMRGYESFTDNLLSLGADVRLAED